MERTRHIKNGSKSYCGLSNSTYTESTPEKSATCKRCIRDKAAWDRIAKNEAKYSG